MTMFRKIVNGARNVVDRCVRGAQRCKQALMLAAAVIVVGGAAEIASATPPSMPAITFPINQASIGTAVVAAGAAILITTFGVMIGFKLIRKLTRRVTGSV